MVQTALQTPVGHWHVARGSPALFQEFYNLKKHGFYYKTFLCQEVVLIMRALLGRRW